MKKNIFVIGSQGYNKNYGGWETFVSSLVDKSFNSFFLSLFLLGSWASTTAMNMNRHPSQQKSLTSSLLLMETL